MRQLSSHRDLPPAQQQQHHSLLQIMQTSQQQQHSLERRLLRQDGSSFWGNVSFQAIYGDDGQIEAVVGVLIDVTERKRFEGALKQAYQRLRSQLSELDQRTREMALMSDLGDFLQSLHHTDEAYQVFTQIASHLFPQQVGALYLFHADPTQAQLVTTWGEPMAWPNPVLAQSCFALLHSRPYTINNPSNRKASCPYAPQDHTRDYICIPLSAQGETLGMLRIGGIPTSTTNNDRQRSDWLMMTVADQLAMGLSNLQLRTKLQEQAIRDPLTGLFNRRYLDETLSRELKRAARHQHTVGVMMIDIDFLSR
ncbi:MAG: diguanylate cyclase [Chloroflexaceae bacterium]|nr:diguanylate cyclase [Chloroflexaceae bacterium]